MMLTGGMPWWYDAAHNFILAWDHLQKPTLIGPASGIPGIFYGPYWIWLISLPMLVSKNPRFVGLIVCVIPYYTLFPLALFQFTKLFGKRIVWMIWLLFIMSTGIHYSTQLWSPNYAPLVVLWLITVLFFTDRKKAELRTYFRIFVTGVIAALLINVHLSFGIATLFGTGIYFLIELILDLKRKKANVKEVLIQNVFFGVVFSAGATLIFLPTLVFEYRHGFQQLQAVMNTFLKYGEVVSHKGLSKLEVLDVFFGRVGLLLHLHTLLGYILQIIVVFGVLRLIKKKKWKMKEAEKKLFRILFSFSGGLLFIYLSARNPIWNYHFIGTEIIFLFMIALLALKFPIIKKILTLWMTVVVGSFVILTIQHFTRPKLTAPDLKTKEYITDRIAIDARRDSYVVFNYSPAIYTYEYTYLFKWKYGKDVPYDPAQIPTGERVVYLNIPTTSNEIREDYIHYHTPQELYTTEKTWNIPDGSVIIKRVKK